MNTTRTTAALAGLTALHAGDQDAVNAALQAAGKKPRDINDIGLLPLLGDLIAQDVNELDNNDPQLADQLSDQQVRLDEPNPEIPEIVQAIQQLLDVIERKYPSKAIEPPTAVVSAALVIDTDHTGDVPELDEAHIDPLDSEEDEPELTPDAPEADEQVEDDESEEVLENETEMDMPPEPAAEEEAEAGGDIDDELADPETEEEPASEEDEGDDEVEDEVELDGGDAVLALAGALASNLVTRADARDYVESLADAVVDDDTAATLRRVHEALGDSDYTDADVIKKLRTAAAHHRDRLDEVCIDLPESIASAKLEEAPKLKIEAPVASKLVADDPVDSSVEDPEDDDGDDKDSKSKSAPIRITGDPKTLEATVVITDDESEVYEREPEQDDDEDDLDVENLEGDSKGTPPEQPPLLELDEDDDSDEDEWTGTQWRQVPPPLQAAAPSAAPTGKPMIQLATTRVPQSEAQAQDPEPEPEEPEVVDQSELTPEPASRQVPPPLQAAAPSRGPKPAPTSQKPPATPRGDDAEDTLEGLSPGQTPDPAPETQPANNSSGEVETSKGVSMRTLGLTAALVAVVALVAIVVAAGGLVLTGAGVSAYQLFNGEEQVAANPGPGQIVRPAPAPVAPRPQPTRSASVWDSAMQSGGNVYVSTGSAEWVLYETRKVNGDVRYSGGTVDESCLNGGPGVHDATTSCPRRERLF